ncbi:alpha/beta hydrolase [Sphingomonas sp. MG17]|uniref:Alpha/beta hydrolase n=1 Tax=Sphingomonas tagetis TaxID=2949092 RepID=A0A9X2KQX6_9SPHN|nr:alpha/beta hydrolase [Sphingomonas tagetis]MCP3732253.1 alpha/beta hydrolase [Sphingomonas tagetis]
MAARVIVPLLVRKRSGRETFRQRIAADRATGPALPSAKLQKRYAYADTWQGGDRRLRLATRQGGRRTRILYIHGGAYVFDLMALQWTIIAGVIERTGAEAVLPIYPLAPEANVTAGLACVERAWLALVEEAGADDAIIMGDSAGAGLALALVHRLRDTGLPMPRALVLLFPWLDATLKDPSQPALERRDPVLSIAQLRDAGQMWAATQPPSIPSVSPLFGDQAGLPPTLAIVGTRDVLLPDARRLVAMTEAAELIEYPGMFHGFVAAPIAEGRDAMDRIAAFLQRNLAHSM